MAYKLQQTPPKVKGCNGTPSTENLRKTGALRALDTRRRAVSIRPNKDSSVVWQRKEWKKELCIRGSSSRCRDQMQRKLERTRTSLMSTNTRVISIREEEWNPCRHCEGRASKCADKNKGKTEKNGGEKRMYSARAWKHFPDPFLLLHQLVVMPYSIHPRVPRINRHRHVFWSFLLYIRRLYGYLVCVCRTLEILVAAIFLICVPERCFVCSFYVRFLWFFFFLWR